MAKTWTMRRATAALVLTSLEAAGFVVAPARPTARGTFDCRRSWAPRMTYGDYYDDIDIGDDDGEEPPGRAYGNRSLAWTRRFRRLLPYEWARREARKLGLRSREEWDDHLADGKSLQNKYLPNRPDEMYAADWVSWEEFLGIMRSYDEARHLVQRVLRLRTMEEYVAFVRADPQRAEGLRIPYKPDVVYRDKGWVDDDHFFTLEEDG